MATALAWRRCVEQADDPLQGLGHPRAATLRHQLRTEYTHLLLSIPNEKETEIVVRESHVNELWKQVYYCAVEMYRKRITLLRRDQAKKSTPSGAHQLGVMQKALKALIEEALEFYHRLWRAIVKRYALVDTLHVTQAVVLAAQKTITGVNGNLQTSQKALYSPETDSLQPVMKNVTSKSQPVSLSLIDAVETKAWSQALDSLPTLSGVTLTQRNTAHLICYRLLLNMGDLVRYREQMVHSEQRCNWSLPALYYSAAAKWMPEQGHAFNQLAVVASHRQQALETLYYYFRSLMCTVPFKTAQENMMEYARNHLVRVRKRGVETLSLSDATTTFIAELFIGNKWTSALDAWQSVWKDLENEKNADVDLSFVAGSLFAAHYSFSSLDAEDEQRRKIIEKAIISFAEQLTVQDDVLTTLHTLLAWWCLHKEAQRPDKKQFHEWKSALNSQENEEDTLQEIVLDEYLQWRHFIPLQNAWPLQQQQQTLHPSSSLVQSLGRLRSMMKLLDQLEWRLTIRPVGGKSPILSPVSSPLKRSHSADEGDETAMLNAAVTAIHQDDEEEVIVFSGHAVHSSPAVPSASTHALVPPALFSSPLVGRAALSDPAIASIWGSSSIVSSGISAAAVTSTPILAPTVSMPAFDIYSQPFMRPAPSQPPAPTTLFGHFMPPTQPSLTVSNGAAPPPGLFTDPNNKKSFDWTP